MALKSIQAERELAACCGSALAEVKVFPDFVRRDQGNTPMISTREFVIEDYDGAVALWHLAEGVEVAEGDSKEEIRAYLLRNPGLSRVAEEDGTMVAAVLCGHDGHRGLIYHLAVAQASRGKGIGKLLVQECITRLRTTGIARALILVAGDNARAHSFWLRAGWEDVPGAMLMGIDL